MFPVTVRTWSLKIYGTRGVDTVTCTRNFYAL